MKYRENNIFHNIIRNETTLTEVFCNLMRYKAFRMLFLKFVDEQENLPFSHSAVRFEDFETEKDFGFYDVDSDKKMGRGDLILTVDEKDYIFELKIEVTTRTTGNQPDGYIEYLERQDKEEKNKNYKERLYFILPKGYKHIDSLNNVIHENILYWEDFLDTLRQSDLAQLNIFIDEFYKIVYETWFYTHELQLNEMELDYIYNNREIEMQSSTIPKIMIELFTIVDELEELYKKTYKIKSVKKSNEYGFYIKNSESECIVYIGIDFLLWEEKSIPLAIGLEDDGSEYSKKFIEYISDLTKMEYKDDNVTYYYKAICREVLMSEDIKDISEVIDNVLGQIDLKI